MQQGSAMMEMAAGGDSGAGRSEEWLSAALFTLADAQAAAVVWARVKGYPWWPAQVLNKAAAVQHLAGVPHKSSTDVPVIFFGTSEIAWMGGKDVLDWQRGMQQSLHQKGRKNKKFGAALEQVHDFVAMSGERIAPPGWWCAPPARGAAADPEQQHWLQLQHSAPQQHAPSAGARHQQQQHAPSSRLPLLQAVLQQQQHNPFAAAASAAAAAAAAASAAAAADGGQGVAAPPAPASKPGRARGGGGAMLQRQLSAHHHHHQQQQQQHRPLGRSACAQIWGTGGGGGGSGAAPAPADSGDALGPGGRQQRKRKPSRLVEQLGGSDSDEGSSEQQLQGPSRSQSASRRSAGSSRGAAPARGVDGSAGPMSYVQAAKKRRLVARAADGAGGSESDATDTESLAMAAVAIAQLASGDWGDRCPPAPLTHQQLAGTQDAGADDVDDRSSPAGDGLSLQLRTGSDAAASCRSSMPQPCDYPAGVYEHGGDGHACSASWQYVVAMPASSCSAVAAQQPEADPQQQQDVEQQQAQRQAIPAVAACPDNSYYRQLFVQPAGAGNGADEDVATAAAGDEVGAMMQDGSGAASACVGDPQQPGPPQQMAAAATLAIQAAFSGRLAQLSPQQLPLPLSPSQPPPHYGPGMAGPDATAATSSGAPRAPGGSGGSRRRNAAGAGMVGAAAAAAAQLAASHVITAPHPALDAAVAALLLRGPGPVLPAQAGAPDTGFVLPRQLLLNRPPKFELLKRNTFVSRERPKRLAKHDVHVCVCRPERVVQPDGSEVLVGCHRDCLNRLSHIHCDPRTCPCGALCSNRPFHLLRPPPVEVFLTRDRGHGVRAIAPLPKGAFVVEYAGEVIDQAELSARMDAARDSGEQHFYIMELAPGLFIDARRKGNHARLLNSCCEPNCETQKWRDAATGELRIGIFTTRPVAALEELTYDYMFEHSGVGALAQGFKCMCGAKNCRGTMDINPERKRDWGRRLEVFWEGDGVYYRGTVTGYTASTGRHTVMYDDGDVERVKLAEVPHRWLDTDGSPLDPAPAGGDSASGAAAADSGSCSQAAQGGADAAAPEAASQPTIGLRVAPAPASPVPPLWRAAAPAADDAAAAADALVTLGLAAAAAQSPQGHGAHHHSAQQHHVAQGAGAARARHTGVVRRQGAGHHHHHHHHQHGSSASSLGWNSATSPTQRRRGGGGGGGGEFLPWEQLLSGMRTINAQGPPLFQQQQRAPPLPRGGQQQRPHGGRPLPSSGSKFGQLLGLVGRVLPAIERSGSGSDISSAGTGCALPLFKQQPQQPQQPQQGAVAAHAAAAPAANGAKPGAAESCFASVGSNSSSHTCVALPPARKAVQAM